VSVSRLTGSALPLFPHVIIRCYSLNPPYSLTYNRVLVDCSIFISWSRRAFGALPLLLLFLTRTVRIVVVIYLKTPLSSVNLSTVHLSCLVFHNVSQSIQKGKSIVGNCTKSLSFCFQWSKRFYLESKNKKVSSGNCRPEINILLNLFIYTPCIPLVKFSGKVIVLKTDNFNPLAPS